MPLLTTAEKEEFGIKVRDARKNLKITQGQLATRIAQPVAVISNLEIGLDARLNKAALKELCQILQIPEPT